MKKKYVVQLSKKKQEMIKKDLKTFFITELNLNDQEVQKELELAMNSKLTDLEDSIDINQYIN